MNQKSGGGRGIFGKLFFTLFLAAFLGMGSWFTYLMVEGFVYQIGTSLWPVLDCTILSSTVEENPGAPEHEEPYAFRVRYRWATDFSEGTSDVYRHGYYGSSDIGEALRLAQRYPEGAQVPCRVNPGAPDSAVLELASSWNVLWIFVPLLFVAVGAGGIYLTWRGPSSLATSRLGTSISSRVSSSFGGAGCLAAFFSVFLIFGLLIFVPFFAVPLAQSWSASGWAQVPCLIEYSAVRTHPGDDGATYSVEVLYSYEVGGRQFKSSRYDFFTGSDSEYSSKSEWVQSHPEGTRTTCFVNPEDPLDAVVRLGSLSLALWGLLPLIFVAVGGIGVAGSLLSLRRKGKARARDVSRPSDRVPVHGTGPLVLEAAASPLSKLVTGTIFALIWNGITGIFVWVAVTGWADGEEMGCLALFLIPFVLIGLAALVNIPYLALAMVNPRPRLTLDKRRLTLGSSATLSWRFRGATRRLRRLRITLEGIEKVTYRRGTNTRTDTNTFATMPVVDLPAGTGLESGQAHLEIPPDTMHSFKASHNEVVWKLRLQGEIRVWPDVLTEFEVEVEPPAR